VSAKSSNGECPGSPTRRPQNPSETACRLNQLRNNIQIALRFLRAKKRAMLMSLAGITFGVALFIATQAQTSGFEAFFVETILQTDGAIRVQDRAPEQSEPITLEARPGEAPIQLEPAQRQRFQPGIDNPRQVAQAVLEFPNVAGVSEVLRGEVEVTSNVLTQPGRVFGIDLEAHLLVSSLDQQLTAGTLQAFRDNPRSVILGALLASRLDTLPGDYITIQRAGRGTRFRVAAIFESGVEHVDKRRIFMHLPEARTVLDRPFGASYLQVALYDDARARETARRIEHVTWHLSTPWQERERVWLDVFQALRVSSALTVGTIILVSGLGIFNTLAIIVMEKAREIAILRSMGYTRRDIAQIFLIQGTIVLFSGSLLGCALGAGVTWGVANIPLRIRGIFTTDSFIVHWSANHYLFAVAATAIVVMVASYLPARRAARIEPGAIIRGATT